MPAEAVPPPSDTVKQDLEKRAKKGKLFGLDGKKIVRAEDHPAYPKDRQEPE